MATPHANGRDERLHRPRIVLVPIENMQHHGVVKWFDEAKGFGFIIPDDGSRDVFVHKSIIRLYGLRPELMITGVRVAFNMENAAGRGPSAVTIGIL